jgi:hypothetical protein
MVLSSCLLLKSWKDETVQAKKAASATNRPMYFIQTYTRVLSHMPRLVPFLISSVAIPHVEVLSYSPTLPLHFFSQVISFFLLWERGGGLLILHFVFLKQLYIYTYQFQHFKTLLHAYFTYYEMHCISRINYMTL